VYYYPVLLRFERGVSIRKVGSLLELCNDARSVPTRGEMVWGHLLRLENNEKCTEKKTGVPAAQSVTGFWHSNIELYIGKINTIIHIALQQPKLGKGTQ
jgi:hypothetical protein